MNKLHLISLFILLFTATTCKSQNYKETRNVIIPLVESYIKYKNEKVTIDNKKNILVIGANIVKDNKVNKDLSISFYFINPKLLLNFNYSKVYEINEYKMIVDESLDKSDILQYTFNNLEIAYENFNLAKAPFSYNADYWHITLNGENEVVEILPQEKSGEIKSILEKKGVKFSKDYVD